MKNIGILILVAFVFGFSSCKKDHCDDGKNNQDEHGVDCGGKDCKPCESCFDGIKNQGEEDVDCGGPCAACELNWTEVHSGSIKLNSVSFYQNVGLAVGNSGLVVKSLDSGKTWTTLSSGTSNDLKSVHVINESNYFICGKTDLVLHSSDGNTFKSIGTGITADWYDINFSSSTTGNICGSDLRIMYTSDGGKTWIDKISPKPSLKQSFVSMSFLTDLEGYVIGGSELLRTLDGGKNWVSIDGFSASPDFKDFNDIHYKTSSDVYCVTNSGMFISVNSTNWADKLLNVSDGSVDFYNQLGLYSGNNTAKSEGKVLISEDGGVRWEEQDINKSIQYSDGVILSKSVMVVVGDKGTIIRRDK